MEDIKTFEQKFIEDFEKQMDQIAEEFKSTRLAHCLNQLGSLRVDFEMNTTWVNAEGKPAVTRIIIHQDEDTIMFFDREGEFISNHEPCQDTEETQ